MGNTCTAGCDYVEVAKRLQIKAAAKRIPIEGSVELTARCNLVCTHCYIGRPADSRSDCDKDLDTGQIFQVLGQLAESGCLWLGLTGGEPLVRRDFLQIYKKACDLGFLVTLLTNGTLITDKIADTFKDYPPLNIEVTLYGNTKETYERVTQVSGSFDKCIKGIDLLQKRGIMIRLKTTISTLNIHEYDAMRQFAEKRGVSFRADAMLSSRLDGQQIRHSLLVSPDEIVDLEISDPLIRKALQNKWDNKQKIQSGEVRLFKCNAGLSSFHVDYSGRLIPCVMVRKPAFSLVGGSFEKGWNQDILAAVSATESPNSPCLDCDVESLCDCCPGWGLLEEGAPEKKVERLCQVACERADRLGQPDFGRQVI